MKTIKEWFETLPEPIRSQALENTDADTLNTKRSDIECALLDAFDWNSTPQNTEYWNKIYNLALRGFYNNTQQHGQ